MDPNDNAEFSSTKIVSSDPCFMTGQLRDHWVLISIFIPEQTDACFYQTCQKKLYVCVFFCNFTTKKFSVTFLTWFDGLLNYFKLFLQQEMKRWFTNTNKQILESQSTQLKYTSFCFLVTYIYNECKIKAASLYLV